MQPAIGQGSTQCMLIAAPAGMGRTVLLHQYAGHFAENSSPQRNTLTAALTPLVGLKGGRDPALAVIKTLNPPKRQRPGSVLDGIKQVKALVAKRETGAIFIDKVEGLRIGNATEPWAWEFLCELLDHRVAGLPGCRNGGVLAGEPVPSKSSTPPEPREHGPEPDHPRPSRVRG
ncbi:hypothetical protein [Microvirga makkahensis]|uniref:Uncharacterized protein n=1 Tax=Microvirga makkahensis TaxID=1128670 RepID=A0A7X3MNR2_9HYPH|nr:hypothetical protein [Microvirga makkahensis]MXQ10434.1 hypothetical protein [Microvirga makkahensis]